MVRILQSLVNDAGQPPDQLAESPSTAWSDTEGAGEGPDSARPKAAIEPKPFALDELGPQAMATLVGVDKVFASRLLKAMRAEDPLATLQAIPGPEPLKKFIGKATRKGVSRVVGKEATAAVDAFDRLIRDEAGNRTDLDIMLSAWVPGSRRSLEVANKQRMHRAHAQLHGVSSLAQFNTTILMPNESQPDSIDVGMIFGQIGIHRTRPGAHIRFVTRSLHRSADRRPHTFDGEPIDALTGTTVRSIDSLTSAVLSVEGIGSTIIYTLEGTAFGPKSATNFVFGEVTRNAVSRFRAAESSRRQFFFSNVSAPTQLLSFDLVVHKELYQEQVPELMLHDTVFLGNADVNDPLRAPDELDFEESLQSISFSSSAMSLHAAPQYVGLVTRSLRSLNANPDDFRVFRCHIDNPIYGSQVSMCFVPPPRPE